MKIPYPQDLVVPFLRNYWDTIIGPLMVWLLLILMMAALTSGIVMMVSAWVAMRRARVDLDDDIDVLLDRHEELVREDAALRAEERKNDLRRRA